MNLDHLNPPQRQAVLSEAPALLVLAGAGTGKTQVITHRVADFVTRRGVPARRILAVTFTNKAAGAMRDRAAALLQADPAALDIGTFHRIAGRVLRRHAPRLGLTRDFGIFDADDQLQVLKACLAELNLDSQQFPPRQMRSHIEGWKNKGLGPDQVGATSSPAERQAREVYPRYQARLRAQNAVDFTDMLLCLLDLCRGHHDVRGELRGRWSHLLVDEYQDTNHVQHLLLKELVTPAHSLTVVGDDDQSIYRWRGADVGNILRFERDFQGAEVIRLEQNYRCTGTILAAANAVIAHNVGRRGKTLFCAGNPGSKVALRLFDSERDEGAWVADEIRAALEQGVGGDELAILYRTNSQSRPLEEALRRQRIPYRLLGGLRFYDRREVKDSLAFLRLLVSPQSDLDFLRVVNLPSRGLGKASLDRLRQAADDGGESLMATAQRAAQANASALTARARAALATFVAQYASWRQELDDGEAAGRVLEHILQDTGYLEALRSEPGDEGDERIGNLRELVAALDEYVAEASSPSLAGFLEDVALATDADRLEEGAGQVLLMTLHAAKGLEFDRVFMPGMEEGLFPHGRSLDDRAAVEEERRLCYVGITRARHRLALSAARVRHVFGQPQLSELSRFVGELPKDLLDLGGMAAAVEPAEPGEGAVAAPMSPRRPRAARPRGPPAPAQDEAASAADFAPGTVVFHPRFGAGQVLRAEGLPGRELVTVRFPSGPQRVIVGRFLEHGRPA